MKNSIMSILTTYKDLLIESLKEHKKMIIILYALFIISFIATWVLAGDTISSNVQSIMNSTATVPTPAEPDINPAFLFIHNAGGGLITYFGSIFFGIVAIAMIIYNGANLGATGPVFSAVKANGGLQYLIYLIPHGIFEITGTIIQSVAGILLFMFVWRFLKGIIKGENGTRLSARDSFEKNKKVLIQSVVLLIFATILMLIAAPIEAYFSVPFSEMILGV